MPKCDMKTPTQLYRHFDAEGRLLYVGVSLSAIARLGQHKKAPWFGRIATVTVENFPTRAAALSAEMRAIQRENPQHNIDGLVRRTPVRTAESTKIKGVTIKWTKGALELLKSTERDSV